MYEISDILKNKDIFNCGDAVVLHGYIVQINDDFFVLDVNDGNKYIHSKTTEPLIKMIDKCSMVLLAYKNLKACLSSSLPLYAGGISGSGFFHESILGGNIFLSKNDMKSLSLSVTRVQAKSSRLQSDYLEVIK